MCCWSPLAGDEILEMLVLIATLAASPFLAIGYSYRDAPLPALHKLEYVGQCTQFTLVHIGPLMVL